MDSFNPRAREGRDKTWPLIFFQSSCFNPRAREGRDLVPVILSLRLFPRFNPRAREGRDDINQTDEALWQMFQSTRPRGARLFPPLFGVKCKRFNPRAREGRDDYQGLFQSNLSCFNPRAREGRDADSFPSKSRSAVSIHAPARGATPPDACTRP